MSDDFQPREFPIIEHDPSPRAIIEPADNLPRLDVAEHCVFCFFTEVIARLAAAPGTRLVRDMLSAMGSHPLYEVDWAGRRLAVFHPGIGGPLAGALMDEVIAVGCRKFIACGSAGALSSGLVHGHILVPTAAVRDEGTSYHYLPPSREVEPSPEALAAIEAALRERGIEHTLGKTWTTDAFYRETPARVARRRAEGCLVVEMEAAAFFAVARFRSVPFGQLLYAADDVSGEAWDSRRDLSKEQIHDDLFALAAEACLRL
jgi:uridine phosphorylase